MNTQPDQEDDTTSLTPEENKAVAERRSGSAKVVHEVIRIQGDDELNRPALSLLCSGFAAGVGISASLLTEAFLHQRLPDASWTPLVTSFGYCVGFVIVILGNLQLFTENTITVVLPVAVKPSLGNFGRLGRLWGLAIVANLAGTLLVAAMLAHKMIVSPEQLDAAVVVSARLLDNDALTTLLRGIPAGFLVASIAWILPNARGSEFWVVVMITYVIAIGGFSHVVAGSAEAWLLWLTGKASLGWALGGFIGPALAGNIIGGTGLFAVLAHGQVRDEINTD
nr:formate/nitrite transporter family protein [Polymorphobacter sp.]